MKELKEEHKCKYCTTILVSSVSIESGLCDMWCFDRYEEIHGQ